MDYTVSIDIHASPEKVWSELIDVERWPESTPSMTRVERLDNGPFGIGSRARVTQPKLSPMVWTVTDFEPGRSFSWTARATGITIVGEHSLSPKAEDTVTLTLGIRATGPLGPLVSLLTAKLTQRYVNMEAEGLKHRCEMTMGALE